MENLLFPLFMLTATFLGGGILLFYLKHSKRSNTPEEGSMALQTAQQFINVKDIQDR